MPRSSALRKLDHAEPIQLQRPQLHLDAGPPGRRTPDQGTGDPWQDDDTRRSTQGGSGV